MDMAMDGLLIAVVVLLALVMIWVICGYINYLKFKKNLLWFKERYNYFIYMEKIGGSVQAKVDYFNQREELIHEHPYLYEEMKSLVNAERYWGAMLFNYLVMGLAYNLI